MIPPQTPARDRKYTHLALLPALVEWHAVADVVEPLPQLNHQPVRATDGQEGAGQRLAGPRHVVFLGADEL